MQSPETRRRRSGSLGRVAGSYLPPPPPPGSSLGGGGTSMVLAPVFERFHSFKDFMLLQKDTLEAERAVQLYDQYRYDFKVHTARVLFSQHQDMGFLKQRFDPAFVRQFASEKTQYASKAGSQFIAALREGVYDSLNLSVPLIDPKQLHNVVSRDPVPSHRVIGKWTASEASEMDVTQSPFFGINPNRTTASLVVRKLPGNLTRSDLYEACKTTPGLMSITLMPSCLIHENQRALLVQSRKESRECSESELAGLERAMNECYAKSKGSFMVPLQTAWIEFESEEACANAELLLEKKPIGDHCTITPFKIQPKRSAPIHVCALSTESRLSNDVQQTKALILKLDMEFGVWGATWPAASLNHKMEEKLDDASKEAGEKMDQSQEKMDYSKMDDDITELDIKEVVDPVETTSSLPPSDSHPLFKIINNLSLHKRLDIQLLYLRKIHFMDFYSAKLCWSERELFESCGASTIRLASDLADVMVIDDTGAEFMVSLDDEARFDKKVHSILHTNFMHWRTPVDDNHPLFADLWARFCDEKTMLVETEKYRCGICRKLFKGAEFVHKHLKNKHLPEVEPVRMGVTAMLMKQAFENDDQKLLLFVQPTDDFQKAFQSVRPVPTVQMRNSDAYVPVRRKQPHHRGGPVLSGDRPYRDWDAPRTRLVEKSGGGNFRTMMRYDDL